MNTKLLRQLGAAFTGILFFASLFILAGYFKKSSGFPFSFSGISAPRIILSLFFTALSYMSMASYDFLAARYAGKKISLWNAAAVSFAANAFGNSLGLSLLSSSAVRLRLYSLWRFSAAEIARVIAFCEISSFTGFCALSSILIFFPSRSLFFTGRTGAGLAASAAVFVILLAAYLIWGGFSKKEIKAFGYSLNPPGLLTVALQVLFSVLEWASAAAAFFILFSADPSRFVFFLAVFLASEFLAIISNVPGGLGVFEASTVWLLSSSGISGPEILGALVVYRIIYYLLPLACSYIVYGAAEAVHARTNFFKKAGELKDLLSSTPGYFFSCLIFSAGAASMFISCVPYIMPRFGVVSSIMPPLLQPFSAVLLSLCGAGLIMCTRGLQKNLYSSYNLSLGLLAACGALLMINSFSYEAASAFYLILLFMLPFGKNFYRKSGPFTEMPTSGFFYAASGTACLCGLAVYLSPAARGQAAYIQGVLSFFSSGAALAIWMIAYIFIPYKPSPHTSTKYDVNTAASIAFNSPDTLSQLALSGDKNLLFSWSRLSFLMYARCGSRWIALGDPCGPYVELEELIWKFRRLAFSHGASCVFFNVSGENLHFYKNTGLNFYKIGDEARIALEYYPREVAVEGLLKSFTKKLEISGYSFRMMPRNSPPSFYKKIASISDEWLKYHGIKEPGFLIGHFDVEYLRHFHIACVFDRNGQPVCFSDIFTGPEHGEYRMDIIRYSRSAPDGVERFLKYNLILWGKEKHFAFFNLGLAPSNISAINSYTPALNHAAAALFNYGLKLSNGRSLRKSKEEFSPLWNPRYIVCDNFFIVPQVFSEISLLSSGADIPGLK
jgi:phosphatidylglycerol lysyltransferase